MKSLAKESKTVSFSTLLATLLVTMISGCGGGGGVTYSPSSTPPVVSGTTYTIGGSVTGLSGSMVLQNNGGDNLTVSASGTFTFATPIASGSTYNVTVFSQPATQICTVTGGSGTATANVTSVSISCAAVPLTLTTVNPTTVTAGGQAFSLTVIGTGFRSNSVVQWNGTNRTTTYVSSTELLAQITAADIAATGTASVTVVNPGPPSVTSSAASVTIAAPSKDAVAFQMDASHTGSINFNSVTLPTTSKWSVNLGGAPSYALTAGGNVFVTVYLASGNSQLVALDQATGATVWGPISLSGTANAAYDNGTVFVLSSVFSVPSVMQAYDAATGTLKWTTALTGQYSSNSPPTAADGYVYGVGTGTGGTLYAVDQATGAITWNKPVANGDDSAPVVSADGVYVNYPCETYDFRPATGESVWSNNTGCSGGGGATPVLANGVLYAPNGFGTYNGSTFNAETGALLGTYTADNPPAIPNSTNGYFLQGGILNGITLPGTVAWSFTGDGLLVTSPIVVTSGTSTYVFIGSSAGNLYAVDGATGTKLWTVNVGAAIPNGAGWGTGMQFSGLSAGNGLLFVPAGNTLTAYTLSTAP